VLKYCASVRCKRRKPSHQVSSCAKDAANRSTAHGQDAHQSATNNTCMLDARETEKERRRTAHGTRGHVLQDLDHPLLSGKEDKQQVSNIERGSSRKKPIGFHVQVRHRSGRATATRQHRRQASSNTSQQHERFRQRGEHRRQTVVVTSSSGCSSSSAADFPSLPCTHTQANQNHQQPDSKGARVNERLWDKQHEVSAQRAWETDLALLRLFGTAGCGS
jgi:hypothetical protein